MFTYYKEFDMYFESRFFPGYDLTHLTHLTHRTRRYELAKNIGGKIWQSDCKEGP